MDEVYITLRSKINPDKKGVSIFHKFNYYLLLVSLFLSGCFISTSPGDNVEMYTCNLQVFSVVDVTLGPKTYEWHLDGIRINDATENRYEYSPGESGEGIHKLMVTVSGSSHTWDILALEPAANLAHCPDAPLYKDPSQSVEVRIDDLLPRMSLAEKIDQMSMPSGIDPDLDAIIAIAIPKAGFVNKRLGIPALKGAGSSRGAIIYGTAFPVSMIRGASWDRSLEYRIGEAIGVEAQSIGANVVYEPTINIVRHPGWGRAQESYGEDTYHMGEIGVMSIKGLQTNAMAGVKHFALNSIEEDRFHINVKVDERTLREIYLLHFKVAVHDADVASIMSAYNLVNGQYMGENKHILRDILKGEWGFDGFVHSDWTWGTRSTVDTANNGLDIEMPSPVFYGDALLNAVKQGDVSEEIIDDAVSRILRKKFAFGLFENEPETDLSVLRSEKHRELALEAGRKGVVLLKNENNALPIKRQEDPKVAVFGKQANWPILGDVGSSSNGLVSWG